MPKVSEAYIEKKKQGILDAAFRVFQHKPLYEMTMLDVVKEAGLSRGGIYKYYDNVDQVIVAMTNQVTAQNNMIQTIDQILANANDSKEAIEELLLFLGKYIQDHVNTIGKIQFELTVLVANHPEKAASIMNNLTEQEAGQYLIQCLFQQMMQGSEDAEFEPRFPLEEVVAFVGTYIDGLLRNAVLIRCYKAGANELDEVRNMQLLTETVFYMLGVEEKKAK